eukprot:9213075-Heterocapsa_arctica.AAC.1
MGAAQRPACSDAGASGRGAASCAPRAGSWTRTPRRVCASSARPATGRAASSSNRRAASPWCS